MLVQQGIVLPFVGNEYERSSINIVLSKHCSHGNGMSTTACFPTPFQLSFPATARLNLVLVGLSFFFSRHTSATFG
jgi:hypothetical protein